MALRGRSTRRPRSGGDDASERLRRSAPPEPRGDNQASARSSRLGGEPAGDLGQGDRRARNGGPCGEPAGNGGESRLAAQDEGDRDNAGHHVSDGHVGVRDLGGDGHGSIRRTNDRAVRVVMQRVGGAPRGGAEITDERERAVEERLAR